MFFQSSRRFQLFLISFQDWNQCMKLKKEDDIDRYTSQRWHRILDIDNKDEFKFVKTFIRMNAWLGWKHSHLAANFVRSGQKGNPTAVRNANHPYCWARLNFQTKRYKLLLYFYLTGNHHVRGFVPLPPHFCFTWCSCKREEKTGFQLLISFSENMVVEDELDYLEISTNNQTVDTPPCSCPSSTVRKWKPTLPNAIVIVIVIVIAIDTDIVKFNFFIQVVPYTELCLEGIAIPLLGGAGILGNVAAVVVLRFIIIIIIIVTSPRSLCGPINFRECLGVLLRAYILDVSFKNPKHWLLKSIHKQTKS